MEINCPPQLNDLSAAEYLNSVWRSKNEKELTLNFSTLKFVYPSGVLILAIGIRDIVSKRTILGLETHASGVTGKGAASYLAYFGFFQFVGVDIGNHPNEARGGRKYLPITTMNREDFNDPTKVIQEQITRQSYNLASIIYPDEADITKVDMLAYCLREVIRNVFEHADTNHCFVMAQRWVNGYAEIAIADEGIGIPVSLAQTHEIKSVRSALKLAIQPGISRIDDPETGDKWQNSGFGLYVVSQIGSQSGEFSLLSNGSMLRQDGENFTWVATPVNGTVVKLRTNTSNSDYFPNIMKLIVDQGEKEAEQIPGARVTASKGSKLINDIEW